MGPLLGHIASKHIRYRRRTTHKHSPLCIEGSCMNVSIHQQSANILYATASALIDLVEMHSLVMTIVSCQLMKVCDRVTLSPYQEHILDTQNTSGSRVHVQRAT